MTNKTGWGSHKKPTSLNVLITRACNLSCSFCYMQNRNAKNDLTTEQLSRKIKTVIKNKPSVDTLIFSGGEPLMRKNDIQKIVLSLPNHLKYIINTNGTLLDFEFIKFCRKNLIKLIINIYAGKGTGNLSKKVPHSLLFKYKKILQSINVEMNLICSPDNVSILFQNVLFLTKINFRYIRLLPNISADWSSEQLDIFNAQLSQVLLCSNSNIINYKNFCQGIKTNKCSQLTLNNNGELYPCRALTRNENNQQFDISNDYNKREIILSKAKIEVMEVYPQCDGCQYKEYCGCPLEAYYDSIINKKNLFERLNLHCKVSKIFYHNFSVAYNTHSISKIWFFVTTNCNNRCSYCFVDHKNDEISKKIILIYLARLFGSKGKKHINIYGGEPLLKFEKVKNIIEYAKKLSIKTQNPLIITLATNAQLIESDHINFFKKFDVNICVSFDGNEDMHNKHRKTVTKKKTYINSLKGLEKLNQLPQEKISCLYGVHPDNVQDFFLGFVHIVKKLKFQNVNIEPIQARDWNRKETILFKEGLIQIFRYILKHKEVYLTNTNKLLNNVRRQELYVFPDGKATLNPLNSKKEDNRNIDTIVKVRDYFTKKFIQKIKELKRYEKYIENAKKRIFE